VASPRTAGTYRAGTLDRVTQLTVSVWNVDLLQPISVVDALRAWLDDDEVHAAATRRADVLRHRYIVAHGAVRSILAGRLGVGPDAVALTRLCDQCGDPLHGKPVLPDHPDLWFSLSHSESFAMVAVASGARVGVDLEIERPRPQLERLAARVLSDEEHAEWLEAEPRLRTDAFLERWTAKEAYLKAIGAGIWRPLRDVPRHPEGWTVSRIASPLGTVASIAVEADARIDIEHWAPPAVFDRPRVGDPGSRPIDKFRGTAVGGVLAAGMLGLRDALEPRKNEEIAIVQDHAGSPPHDDPIELDLDPEHPAESVVRVRPWLRDPPAT
jgi:4'-phosphopantetheinyl transferase